VTGELFHGKSTLVNVVFRRSGDRATVYRRANTPVENKYGKTNDTDWQYEPVGEVLTKRIYGSYEERGGRDYVEGGTADREQARIAVPKDTDVREGDRVVYSDGGVYVLDTQIPRETHIEFKTTLSEQDNLPESRPYGTRNYGELTYE
jgi:hypothetical protein